MTRTDTGPSQDAARTTIRSANAKNSTAVRALLETVVMRSRG